MTTVKCSNCGAEVSPQLITWPTCGTPVGLARSARTGPQTETNQPVEDQGRTESGAITSGSGQPIAKSTEPNDPSVRWNPQLNFGRVLSGIVRAYRRLFLVFILAALVVFFADLGVVIFVLADDTLAVLLTALVILFALLWYQAVVVEAIRQDNEGLDPVSLATVMPPVAARFLPLILSFIIPVVALLVGTFILAILTLGLGALTGLLIMTVPLLFYLTRYSLLVPAVVVDKQGPFEAIGRSFELIEGQAWRVFAVLFTIFIAQGVVSVVLRVIAGDNGNAQVGVSLAGIILGSLWAVSTAIMFFELKSFEGGPLGKVPDVRPLAQTSSPETMPEAGQEPAWTKRDWAMGSIVSAGLFLMLVLATVGVDLPFGGGDSLSDPPRNSTGEIVAAGDINVLLLRVGDCFQDWEGATDPNVVVEDVFELAAVPCDHRHDNDVYALITVTGSEEWPGEPFLDARWNRVFRLPRAFRRRRLRHVSPGRDLLHPLAGDMGAGKRPRNCLHSL